MSNDQNTALVPNAQTTEVVKADDAFLARVNQKRMAGINQLRESMLVPEDIFISKFGQMESQGEADALDIAAAYQDLGTTIFEQKPDGSVEFRRDSEGRAWEPTRIATTSSKSTRNEKIFAKLGNGVLYNSRTEQAIGDTKFFPLFVSEDFRMFKDGIIPACISLDGIRGEVTTDLGVCKPGSVHECGSASCPNPGYINTEGAHSKKPRPYQKGVPQQACQYGKALYLVDKSFQNIWVIPLKNQAIGQTATPMLNALEDKKNHLLFNATLPGASWWTLGTVKTEFKVKGMPAATYYAEAKQDKELLTKSQALALLRLSLLFTHKIFPMWINARDNKSANAATVIADIENAGPGMTEFEGA